MKYVPGKILVILLLAGCTARTVSNTPRTAIEQLLITTAIDNALAEVRIQELKNKKVIPDFSNLQSYDAEYLKSAVRARIAENGSVIVEKAEEADYIVEVSCGGLGNEYKSTILGIPALPVPGSPLTFPELALWKSVEQDGIAKLLITIYSKGKIVSTNHYYGKAERDETFFLWMRSQPKDDIRKAWEKSDKTDRKK